MKRGYVVVSDLVCTFSHFFYVRSERTGYASSSGDCLPDDRRKRCRIYGHCVMKPTHLYGIRIEGHCGGCRILVTSRTDAQQKRFGDTCLSFADPGSTQSPIPNHAQKFCGPKKQLLGRKVKSKCFCNPGDDVEADANVGRIEDRSVGQSSSPQLRDVVEIDLARAQRDLFEQRQRRAQPAVDLSLAPISKDLTC